MFFCLGVAFAARSAIEHFVFVVVVDLKYSFPLSVVVSPSTHKKNCTSKFVHRENASAFFPNKPGGFAVAGFPL